MHFHNWQPAKRLSNVNETNEIETRQQLSHSLSHSLATIALPGRLESAHSSARVSRNSTTFQAGLVSVPVSFRSVLVRFSKRRRGRAVRRESNEIFGQRRRRYSVAICCRRLRVRQRQRDRVRERDKEREREGASAFHFDCRGFSFDFGRAFTLFHSSLPLACSRCSLTVLCRRQR